MSRFLCWILILAIIQSSIAPALLAAEQGRAHSQSEKLSPDFGLPMMDALERMDADKPVEARDNWLIGNQYVEVIQRDATGKETIRQINFANAPLLELPAVSDMAVAYDEAQHAIIFSGLVGSRNQKTGVWTGYTNYRHVIPLGDGIGKITTLSYDKEILVMMDERLQLHAVDYGFASLAIGNAPIPVYQKRWAPPKEFAALQTQLAQQGKVNIELLTRGVKPYQDKSLVPGAVVPKRTDGIEEFKAGDVFLSIDGLNGETRKVLGLFSRSRLVETMAYDNDFIMALTLIGNADPRQVRQLAPRIQALMERLDGMQNALETTNPVRMALRTLKGDIFEQLQNRGGELASTANGTRDRFYQSEWAKDYEKIVEKTAAFSPDSKDTDYKSVEAFRGDSWSKILTQEPEADTDSWKKLKGLARGRERLRQSLVKLRDNIKENHEMLISIGLSGSFGAYAIGFPVLYQKFKILQEISFLTYAYDHWTFPVMKVLWYAPLNAASVFSMYSIIPLMFLSSFAIGHVFRAMAAILQSSQFAKKSWAIRTAKTLNMFVELSAWKRILTFGNIGFAYLLRGFRNVISVTGQQEILPAIDHGLNPFQYVSKRKAKRLNVEGVGGGLAGLRLAITTKSNPKYEKLRAALVSEQRSARSVSLEMSLALAITSEREHLDPGSLAEAIHSDAINGEALLRRLMKDPMVGREMSIVTERTYHQIMDLAEKRGVKSEDLRLDPEAMEEAYKIVQKAAKKLNATYSSGERQMKWSEAIRTQKSVFWSRHQAKVYALDAKNQAWGFVKSFPRRVLALGKKSSKDLLQLTIDDKNATAVKNEYIPDHLVVSSLANVLGPRTDVSNPSVRAASDNPWTLFSSQQHLIDVINNAAMHLFLSSSLIVLTYQRLKAQAEDKYARLEDFTIKSVDKMDAWGRGLYSYLRGIIDPERADLGRIWVRKYMKRIDSIYGILTINIIGRMLISGDKISSSGDIWGSFETALLGSLLVFVAGNWVYGFWWDLLRQGAGNYEDEFKAANQRLNEARGFLSDVLRKATAEEKKVALFEAEKILQELYPRPPENFTESIGLKLRGHSSNADQEAMKAVHERALSEESRAQNPYVTEELEGRAQELLHYSTKNPPIAPRMRNFILMIGPQIAAWATTYMALYLVVDSFDESKVTWENIALETLYSLGWFTFFYFTLRKEAGTYYKSVFKKVGDYFKSKFSPKVCQTAMSS